MKEAAEGARLPDRFGRDPVERSVPELAHQLPKGWLLPRPAHDDVIHLAETEIAKVERCADGDEKENLFNKGEHGRPFTSGRWGAASPYTKGIAPRRFNLVAGKCCNWKLFYTKIVK